jgi:hypothetical protein
MDRAAAALAHERQPNCLSHQPRRRSCRRRGALRPSQGSGTRICLRDQGRARCTMSSAQHDLRNSVIEPKTEVSFPKIPDVVVASQVTTRAPDMSADRGEAVGPVAVR